MSPLTTIPNPDQLMVRWLLCLHYTLQPLEINSKYNRNTENFSSFRKPASGTAPNAASLSSTPGPSRSTAKSVLLPDLRSLSSHATSVRPSMSPPITSTHTTHFITRRNSRPKLPVIPQVCRQSLKNFNNSLDPRMQSFLCRQIICGSN